MKKVLMFGWEFPPYKSGGLGTACYSLTKSLSQLGTKITFVMPFTPDKATAQHVTLLNAAQYAQGIHLKHIHTLITPYTTAKTYDETLNNKGSAEKAIYGRTLLEEVQRYTAAAARIAKTTAHDIIHCHDWMTYQAGIQARSASKKPLVVHLHSTEHDRTGGNPNPAIAHIEHEGLSAANHIITNSYYTKQNILNAYNLPASKISVVHWGIDQTPVQQYAKPSLKEIIVLFLGRITIQKGPDYFVEAIPHVLKHYPNTRFIIAGDGDMLPRIINRTAELGIAHKVHFTGFLTGEDVNKAFQAADLYVMPSVSEPFGLVALESLKNKTPILISKQSGAAEVLTHALKTDFWDVNEMSNKIVSVLKHSALNQELRMQGIKEVKHHGEIIPAQKVLDIYKKILNEKTVKPQKNNKVKKEHLPKASKKGEP